MIPENGSPIEPTNGESFSTGEPADESDSGGGGSVLGSIIAGLIAGGILFAIGYGPYRRWQSTHSGAGPGPPPVEEPRGPGRLGRGSSRGPGRVAGRTRDGRPADVAAGSPSGGSRARRRGRHRAPAGAPPTPPRYYGEHTPPPVPISPAPTPAPINAPPPSGPPRAR